MIDTTNVSLEQLSSKIQHEILKIRILEKEEKKKKKKIEKLSRIGPRFSTTIAMQSELYWAFWSSENGLYSTGNQWAL